MIRLIKILLIVTMLFIVSILIFHPVVIDIAASTFDESVANVGRRKNVKISDMVNIDKDKACAYLVINERYEMSEDFPFGRILKCDDPRIIADIVNTSFMVTGHDMTTVENEIFIYENDVLKFRSEIVLDEGQVGLQGTGYGWIYCSDYKRFLESCQEV